MQKAANYLTGKDTASLVGISPSTSCNWEKQGKLKAHQNPYNSYRLYRNNKLENPSFKIRNSAGSRNGRGVR